MQPVLEKTAFRLNGFFAFGAELVLLGASIAALREALLTRSTTFPGPFWYGLGFLLLIALTAPGFFVVHPNEARVLVFLGRYVGSVRTSGFWWTNPLTLKRRVSLRVHNFSSEKLKVNDAVGNPIEIAAVVVWRVVDSAQALFNVENYQEFVAIQSETAIRALASHHPYDVYEEGGLSLRAHPEEIAERLRQEVQARLNVAGVEVLEARISHLAYAPEIAQAMLRR
ncbi:MAG: SPFH domain-containing protein, partial [Acidobacteria bacterium]|nr:SPFH domain-containing protein [Acidobacteriota bacterium]MDW7984672.1 SPFH domain-containing protein [Acidobacteriota bacterium]